MKKNKRTFLDRAFFWLSRHDLLNWMSDQMYIRIAYRIKMGRKIDFNCPKTFNEKLNWLKVYDRKPIYTRMVDKYEVKGLVSDLIGKEYVIPSIGIWDNFDDIDFDSLPNEFVIKSTHDSGGIFIVRDKQHFDIHSAKDKIEKSMRKNYYWSCREWPYKNVRPRILIEKFIPSGDNRSLIVYKVFNFMGKPKLIQVIQDDKTKNETIDYYNTKWELLEMKQNFPNSQVHVEKPIKLEEMLNVARKLSEGFKFIRTDFYIVENKLYFSEFTFFSDAGFEKFYPAKWDRRLGELIKIG